MCSLFESLIYLSLISFIWYRALFQLVCVNWYLLSWCILYLLSFKWLVLTLVFYFHLVPFQLISLSIMCWFGSDSIGISSHLLVSVGIDLVLISTCLLSCVDLDLSYKLDNLMLCHPLVCLLDLLGVLSKLYFLLVLGSLVHTYFLYV